MIKDHDFTIDESEFEKGRHRNPGFLEYQCAPDKFVLKEHAAARMGIKKDRLYYAIKKYEKIYKKKVRHTRASIHEDDLKEVILCRKTFGGKKV